MLEAIGTFLVCGFVFIIILAATIHDIKQKEKIRKLEIEVETLKRSRTQ